METRRLVAPFAALAVATAAASAPGTVDRARHPPRVGGAGATVSLPRGWHAIRLMVPPPGMQVNDPVTRIVAASARIGFDRGCNDVDYSFPRTAVAVVVLEWVRPTPGHFMPRPRQFTSKSLPVRPPPAIECFDGPGGAAQFADHGRRFEAFVLLGRLASPGLADRARAVLNTLRVKNRRG